MSCYSLGLGLPTNRKSSQLQAILGTQGDAQGSDTSKASKQSSSNKKAASKARKAGSGKENGKPTATKKGKDTADKKPRKKSEKPRKQSAYNVFCAAQRPVLKGEKPDLSMTDVTKELAALWGAKTAEEKKVYQDEADAATAKQLEEFEAGGLEDQKKSSTTAGAKGKAKPKAVKKQSKKSQELKDAEESEDLQEHAAEAEESGDDSDRENCDWEKHPVEAILGTTAHNKFIVKRKGANLCEYGLVDANAVKRQRLDPDIKAPVSLQQFKISMAYFTEQSRNMGSLHANAAKWFRLEEFEEWESKFKAAVRENTDRGALELDNLSKDTPLETCYYLGKMLEKNYPLAKPKKNVDPGRPFPVVALSMVSQRLLDLEKAKVLSLEQRLAERQEE